MRHLGEEGHLAAAQLIDTLLDHGPKELARAFDTGESYTPEIRVVLQAMREYHKDMALMAREIDDIGPTEAAALKPQPEA